MPPQTKLSSNFAPLHETRRIWMEAKLMTSSSGNSGALLNRHAELIIGRGEVYGVNECNALGTLAFAFVASAHLLSTPPALSSEGKWTPSPREGVGILSASRLSEWHAVDHGQALRVWRRKLRPPRGGTSELRRIQGWSSSPGHVAHLHRTHARKHTQIGLRRIRLMKCSHFEPLISS